jgi:DNA-binding beta-propeller fold protein YncE
MKIRFLIAGICTLWLSARAEAATCAAPPKAMVIEVPGRPFAAVATADNCWLFVSLVTERDQGAIAVLRNQDGAFGLDHTMSLQSSVFGAALTHDGKLLLAAAGDTSMALDVAALEQGDSGKALLGSFRNGVKSGAIYAAVSGDDKLLFVSDERAQRISVFDLAKARSDGFQSLAPVGRIPMGIAPVGLALSPDKQWLYATSQVAAAPANAPSSCKAEDGSGRMHPEGLLVRVDVAKAATDPAHAAVAALPAGCNPVRVVVSPSGKRIWVTARGDNALLSYAAGDWSAVSSHASYTSYPIGTSPVGVAVRPDEKQVWVALSNRFGKPDEGEVAGLAFGADASSTKRMSAQAGGFPRETAFLPDGRTLVVTLFDAKRVKLIPTPD